MTVAAVAVMAGALFGSSFTAPQVGGTALETKADPLAKVANMGGLELVMPEAYASGPCADLLDSGRPVVNFDLTGVSVELPSLSGTYSAMTFSETIPGPTLRVTQGDVVHMTLTIPGDEVTQHGNDMHASQMSSKPYMGAVKSVKPVNTALLQKFQVFSNTTAPVLMLQQWTNTYFPVCMESVSYTHLTLPTTPYV